MGFEINGKTYETDEEGYLVNLAEWDEEAAKFLAIEELIGSVITKIPIPEQFGEAPVYAPQKKKPFQGKRKFGNFKKSKGTRQT